MKMLCMSHRGAVSLHGHLNYCQGTPSTEDLENHLSLIIQQQHRLRGHTTWITAAGGPLPHTVVKWLSWLLLLLLLLLLWLVF